MACCRRRRKAQTAPKLALAKVVAGLASLMVKVTLWVPPVHCTADEARGAEMTTGDPATEREEIAKLVQIYIEGGRRVTPPS